MKKSLKCPICGNQIARITNAVTKQSYFKCSNKKCHFVLGEDYTEAEFHLQGTTMTTCCIECGEPLTVTNGPHGLYARCFNCDCDLEPYNFKGRIYPKWVNAHRSTTRSEIESLVKSYNENKKNEEDALYDFDAYIATPKFEKTTNKKERLKRGIAKEVNSEKVLKVLRSTNEALSSRKIGEIIKVQMSSIHSIVRSLRLQGKIKVVGFILNDLGNHTLLYQVTEANLPELKVYTSEDGYNSIPCFLFENKDKYKNATHLKVTLKNALEDNNITPVLFRNVKGVSDGYPSEVLEKFTNKIAGVKPTTFAKNTKEMENTVKFIKKQMGQPRDIVKRQIIELFKQNLEKSYTTIEIAKNLSFSKLSIRHIIRNLRKNKKIKIVGWNYRDGYPGATALKYQLNESPLPRLKVTVDNNLYMTVKQFYDKKLKGKRCPASKLVKKIQSLRAIPLIINQRAYAGYLVSDLKESFKEYLDVPATSKKSRKITRTRTIRNKITKRTAIPVKTLAGGMVSNPVETKKSILNRLLSSFFGKKEKSRV